jgi:hypothetical protein
MRTVYNFYFNVFKAKKGLTLGEFYHIFKYTLLEREKELCIIGLREDSYHECWSCRPNQILNWEEYINNHTRTVLEILFVLQEICPHETEKVDFENIICHLNNRTEKKNLFCLFFQYKMTCERIEEMHSNGHITHPYLTEFRVYCIETIQRYSKLSMDIPLFYFFMTNVFSSFHNDNFHINIVKKRKKYPKLEAYWKTHFCYCNFMSTFSLEVKIQENRECLLNLSKITNYIINSR